jgi:hypothetical protein
MSSNSGEASRCEKGIKPSLLTGDGAFPFGGPAAQLPILAAAWSGRGHAHEFHLPVKAASAHFARSRRNLGRPEPENFHKRFVQSNDTLT